MRLKNIILSSFALAVSMNAAAQNTKTEYEFNPNWYVKGQIGAQYTLGECSFGDLVSTNAELNVGYNFTKIFGLRLGVNAWQSKGGWDEKGASYDWKWNYVAPSLDAVVNLTNVFCEYNPERLFNLSVFGGIGMNIAFNNDEAQDANAALKKFYKMDNEQPLRHLWDGGKVRFMGRFGAIADFRLSDKVSVGLELQANTLNDHYNSKKAKNADWYFNALVGVKYNFGKTYTKKTVTVPTLDRISQPETKVVEKVVEKQVPGPVREIVVVEPLRQDVYFTISSSKVSLTEMQKVKDLAAYLKKYPNSKVEITGHADKNTGSAAINMKLSKQRANVVADTLVDQFGIDRSRIVVKAVGDTEQPHSEVILNRVSVCIAK